MTEGERVPRVTYIAHDGSCREVVTGQGITVMNLAVANNVPGIVAECGGGCSCATCHVYVDGEWHGQLEPAQPEEEELLEFKENRQPNSRLACQIVVTDELDGLVVRTPESQY
jgi:2Fe-2S ferredoxin